MGSCSGQFIAFDKKTGGVAWTYRAASGDHPASFHGDPLITENLILTGTDGDGGGELVALRRDSGLVVWSYPDPLGFSTDLTSLGGLVYSISRSDELVAIAPETGEAIWFFRRNTEPSAAWSSSPFLNDGYIFMGSRDGTVSCLRRESGDTVWVVDLGDRVSTTIIGDDSSLVCGTADGALYKLRQHDGVIIRRIPLNAHASGRPVSVGEHLVILVDEAKEVIGVKADLTSISWRLPSTSRWSSDRPQLWHGWILAGDESGRLSAIEPETGKVVWSHPLSGVIRGIGTDDSTIYVGTYEGTVRALRASFR